MVPDQHLTVEGRASVLRWHPLPFVPPVERVTQAYPVAFVADGRIVLINGHGDESYWNLPGGTVEPGETPEEALRREIAEEACAELLDFAYLGSQEVIGHRDVPYFQHRYAALVELGPWDPQFEIVARQLVAPEDFLAALAWGQAPTAAEILRLAQQWFASRVVR